MKFLLAFALIAQSATAFAGTADEFHARLKRNLGELNPSVAADSIDSLHYDGGAGVAKILSASTLEEALNAGRALNLSGIAEGKAGVAKLGQIKGRGLTIVLLPGVFAEFIKNRAFEDVLEKDSAYREEFRALVKSARDRNDANAADGVDFVRNHGGELASVALDEIISVGEMKVAGNPVRVVLLGTPFGSLESLGRSEARAAIFTRRLEKYLALTGEQDLAFVGYSRGTILGLEMLAEAKQAKRAWLGRTKALISLGGVIWGSALADDALNNEQAPVHRLLGALDSTMQSLELIPEGASIIERTAIFGRNTKRWLGLLEVARQESKVLNKDKDFFSEARSLVQLDPRSPAYILVSIGKELGLTQFFSGYNANIGRARYAIGELASSIRELGTEARLSWWRRNELPKNVTYYALTGVMANPEANAFEKALFANKLAYGNGSYDDTMLLQNRKDYEKISGLSINDSQVSVPQAVFLPKLIAKLNPANRGLRTEFLGVVGTHHWGLALREVNKMTGGQQNGFPREALLGSIAEQVMSEE